MTSPLSPGLAQGCLALLEILQRRQMSAPELVQGLPRVGGMPAWETLALAQTLAWLAVEESGLLTVTPSGFKVAKADCYETALRQIVLDHVELQAPDWVQNATYGRSRVLNFCPAGIRQIFVEAGLAGDPTPDVVDFWDLLASMARGLKKDHLMAIGREGERLTLAHEQARTGAKPRWIAVDSNQDGYDVLSIKASDDWALLSIEVKASRSGPKAELHLTRHEWEIASERANHVFHLWDLYVKPPYLAIVSMKEMAVHVPADAGSGGWESVAVPFEAFSNLFGPQAEHV